MTNQLMLSPPAQIEKQESAFHSEVRNICMNYKRAAKDKRIWGLRLGKKLWEIRNGESTTYDYQGDNRKLLILRATQEFKISKITAERWQARYIKVKPAFDEAETRREAIKSAPRNKPLPDVDRACEIVASQLRAAIAKAQDLLKASEFIPSESAGRYALVNALGDTATFCTQFLTVLQDRQIPQTIEGEL